MRLFNVWWHCCDKYTSLHSSIHSNHSIHVSNLILRYLRNRLTCGNYVFNYLLKYVPLCKTHFTPKYSHTVHIPRGQISFFKLFVIIICPHTFHILASYNDWWPLIYSFKRSWSQSIPYKCMQNWRRIHVTHTHQEVQIFLPTFFGTSPIPIPPISLLLVIIAGSLVEVFSVRAHLHVNGM